MTPSAFSFHIIPDDDLSGIETLALKSMLTEAFEGDFSDEDWQHTFGGIRFIGRIGDVIVAHGAVVARSMQINDNEMSVGYVEGLGVRPGFQGQGFGKRVMQTITAHCIQSYAVSLLSTGEKTFYRQFGWMDFLGRSYIEDNGVITRSYDEDEGLMVLSLTPKSYLQAEIVCQMRSGDAW